MTPERDVWHVVTPEEEAAYEANRCKARRPRTAARCECWREHGNEHVGRDTAGRWHVWEEATRDA